MSAKNAVPDAQARQLGEEIFQAMNRQRPDVDDILWLVRNGASMSVTDRSGMTPLLRAMDWGNKLLIAEMVARGADVNYAGGTAAITAMQVAATSPDGSLVGLMIQAGGDVLKKNARGDNALTIARKRGPSEALDLIEQKAKQQQALADAAERHSDALEKGLPVEKPFRPMKQLRLRPR